jgi:glycosyltransferase involved in cell wall biosynthesis
MSSMKIVWVVPQYALKTDAAGLRTNIASIRYRALIPAQGLIARGHLASVVGLNAERLDEVREQLAGADRVVFIKNYLEPDCSERLLVDMRSRGVKTLFDLTDDRFQGESGGHLQNMVAHAQAVVTVSPALRQIIKQHTGKDSAIVGDPYEGSRGVPKWSPDGRRLKALWFGYGPNIISLRQAFPSLLEAGTKHPMDLRIVTAEVDDIERDCKAFNSKYRHALALRYAKWSKDETWNSLAATDFVVIPALPNSPWTLAKSSNRIIESLWSGRFVVAHPIPSYMEFKDWAWIGPNLAEGIGWMTQNGSKIVERISAAQNHIARAYSPDSIAAQWEQILEKA